MTTETTFYALRGRPMLRLFYAFMFQLTSKFYIICFCSVENRMRAAIAFSLFKS